MTDKEAKRRIEILLKDDCNCPECMKNKEAYRTVLDELEKKDKIIYEIAKSNVKLKGYDIEETYINNTISFYTKYIENLERNPHWRKESRK